MTLNLENMNIISYKFQLTPKITSEAPVNVAECPPLGDGGTPSIYGKAHNHCLSTIKNKQKKMKLVL